LTLKTFKFELGVWWGKQNGSQNKTQIALQ
jgi:hypothetical protein